MTIFCLSIFLPDDVMLVPVVMSPIWGETPGEYPVLLSAGGQIEMDSVAWRCVHAFARW